MSGCRAAIAVACSACRLLRPATFHVIRRTTASHISLDRQRLGAGTASATHELRSRRRTRALPRTGTPITRQADHYSDPWTPSVAGSGPSPSCEEPSHRAGTRPTWLFLADHACKASAEVVAGQTQSGRAPWPSGCVMAVIASAAKNSEHGAGQCEGRDRLVRVRVCANLSLAICATRNAREPETCLRSRACTGAHRHPYTWLLPSRQQQT
jgi:hypothetical protein